MYIALTTTIIFITTSMIVIVIAAITSFNFVQLEHLVVIIYTFLHIHVCLALIHLNPVSDFCQIGKIFAFNITLLLANCYVPLPLVTFSIVPILKFTPPQDTFDPVAHNLVFLL